MRDLYSDDYESVAVGEANRLIPDGVRKLTGAALFLGLIAMMGLWSYRLGTRDAGEVPVIKAAEGPARVEPEDPGGLQAAHQGLEVNAVLAGRPAPMPTQAKPAAPVPEQLAEEDEPQGELVLKAPAAMAQRVLAGADDLPMPRDGATLGDAAAVEMSPPPSPDDALALAEEEEAAPAAADAQRPRNRPANLAVARAKVTPVSVSKPATPAPAPKPANATAAAATPAKPSSPAPAKEVAGLAPGARLVQLGAFDSEAITRQAWQQLVARNGDLLGSKSLFVERTTANARVFYRLRVAGFQNAEQTRALCEALRARGTACIPVTLQ